MRSLHSDKLSSREVDPSTYSIVCMLAVDANSIDSTRIPKALHATHPFGLLPVWRSFKSPVLEAKAIAAEIRRLVVKSNGMIQWRDCAILSMFHDDLGKQPDLDWIKFGIH